jgi:hypothetical protein
VNDVAYTQLFFFLGAMVSMNLVPKVLPVVMVYFFMFLSLIQLILHRTQKTIGLLVIQILQATIVFILFIYVMADDWCFFYLYRQNT